MSYVMAYLPGGFGTREELFEIFIWAQLCPYKKPISILNTGGFYDCPNLLAQTMVDNGF